VHVAALAWLLHLRSRNSVAELLAAAARFRRRWKGAPRAQPPMVRELCTLAAEVLLGGLTAHVSALAAGGEDQGSWAPAALKLVADCGRVRPDLLLDGDAPAEAVASVHAACAAVWPSASRVLLSSGRDGAAERVAPAPEPGAGLPELVSACDLLLAGGMRSRAVGAADVDTLGRASAQPVTAPDTFGSGGGNAQGVENARETD
jgi:hypothetical protein